MERLIGITGRAGAGKDSVWKILDYEIDETVQRLGFADSLKESAMAALGLFGRQAEMFKNEGEIQLSFDGLEAGRLSGREYLQLYGTEAHREIFGDDFWIRQTMKKVSGITVIIDVRYNNEAEAIIEAGGEVWEVRRPGNLIPESGHASERPISRQYIGRVIRNEGSLNDLRYEVMLAWSGEEPSDERLLNIAQMTIDEELRHNFLKRKHLTERAALVAAELSEDPAPTNSKGYKHPW